MDFRQPIEAVVPGVQGRVLGVLAGTTTPLSVRTIAHLAGVSVAQASRILPGLAESGMAERTEVPPSTLYRLVPGHVASRIVLALARVRNTVLFEMTQAAKRIVPAPAGLVVFGSFARGESDTSSDIDVLAIRRDAVDGDDPTWSLALEEWSNAARLLTGNEVAIMEVNETEAGAGASSGRLLWLDLERDGIVLVGRTPKEIELARA